MSVDITNHNRTEVQVSRNTVKVEVDFKVQILEVNNIRVVTKFIDSVTIINRPLNQR